MGEISMTPLSDEELNALEALAKAATPGEWSAHTDGEVKAADRRPVARVNHGGMIFLPDIHHIAAFDPPTVLRLIAQARASRSTGEWREKVARIIDPGVFREPPIPGQWAGKRARALSKADQIAALPPTLVEPQRSEGN